MSAIIDFLRRSRILVYTASLVVSSGIVSTLYYLQATFMAGFPFRSWAIIMPLALTVLTGLAFGTVLNQYFSGGKNTNLRKTIEKQAILNKILIKSKQTNDLLEFLDFVLKVITNTPIANIKPEAGILLMGRDGRLRMVSCLNIKKEQLKICAHRGVAEGECLCGLAVRQKEVIYTDSLDSRHTVAYRGMTNHGQYVVPITYKDSTLGVLSFQLEKGHAYSDYEIEFLNSVADILALVINTYQNEQKDRDSQIVIASARRIAGLANWQVTLPSHEAYWSPEIYRMLGYKQAEVPPNLDFIDRVVHPDDKGKFLEGLRQAEQGRPFEFEVRFMHKQGRVIYLISKCTPNKGIDGKIDRLTGIVFNLTEIREKQAELIAKEAFIESIASDSPYALYLLDIAHKKILFTNREFNNSVDLSLFKDFDTKGIKVFDSFLHKDDVKLFHKTFAKVLEGKKERYNVIARFAYDGKNYRWVNQRFKAFRRDEDNKVTQVLLVGIDIHKQKKAEEKTRELNEKLTRQNKKLKKVNHELDKFIYSTSHDMRAPLSSILGLINLYKRDNDTSTKDIYIDHIESSVVKLEEFIHEIVDFSRNKKTRLYPDKIAITEFLHETYSHLRFINSSNKILFEVVPRGVKEIVTDKERLAIVVRNILSNAIVYANTKVDSFIRCVIEATGSSYIIRIIDNGIGIDAGHLDKVFDMFHRASEHSKGSGLGLYIARETVTMLGGKLGIQSKPFEGTELTIELPKKIPAKGWAKLNGEARKPKALFRHRAENVVPQR